MAKVVPGERPQAEPKPKDDKLTGQARAALVTRLTAMGLRGQDLAALISNGKARGDVVRDLVAFTRALPKGTAKR